VYICENPQKQSRVAVGSMRKLVAPFARQRPAGANPHKEAALWNVQVDQAVHSLQNARKTLLVLQ